MYQIKLFQDFLNPSYVDINKRMNDNFGGMSLTEYNVMVPIICKDKIIHLVRYVVSRLAGNIWTLASLSVEALIRNEIVSAVSIDLIYTKWHILSDMQNHTVLWKQCCWPAFVIHFWRWQNVGKIFGAYFLTFNIHLGIRTWFCCALKHYSCCWHMATNMQSIAAHFISLWLVTWWHQAIT